MKVLVGREDAPVRYPDQAGLTGLQRSLDAPAEPQHLGEGRWQVAAQPVGLGEVSHPACAGRPARQLLAPLGTFLCGIDAHTSCTPARVLGTAQTGLNTQGSMKRITGSRSLLSHPGMGLGLCASRGSGDYPNGSWRVRLRKPSSQVPVTPAVRLPADAWLTTRHRCPGAIDPPLPLPLSGFQVQPLPGPPLELDGVPRRLGREGASLIPVRIDQVRVITFAIRRRSSLPRT